MNENLLTSNSKISKSNSMKKQEMPMALVDLNMINDNEYALYESGQIIDVSMNEIRKFSNK